MGIAGLPGGCAHLQFLSHIHSNLWLSCALLFLHVSTHSIHCGSQARNAHSCRASNSVQNRVCIFCAKLSIIQLVSGVPCIAGWPKQWSRPAPLCAVNSWALDFTLRQLGLQLLSYMLALMFWGADMFLYAMLLTPILSPYHNNWSPKLLSGV